MIRRPKADHRKVAAKSKPRSIGSPPLTPSKRKSDSTIIYLLKKIPNDVPEGVDWLANINRNSLERLT